MSDRTAIEWTRGTTNGRKGATWNPLAGCAILSPGCINCYAMTDAHRLAGNPNSKVAEKYAGTTKLVKGKAVWTGRVNIANDNVLLQPLRWREPRLIFVNSMADLFHESVSDAAIDRIFAVMALCPQHIFQVLTKRTARMRGYLSMARAHPVGLQAMGITLEQMADDRRSKVGSGIILQGDIPHLQVWPLPNVWLGVSAEDQTRADERIPDLLATPAAVRWVSAEPLLGSIDFTNIPSPVVVPEDEGYYHSALEGSDIHYRDGDPDILTGRFITDAVDGPMMERIDWIVVGGESGPHARPMHPQWARDIRDQCAAAGVPFFFKQWGSWLPSLQIFPDGSNNLLRKREQPGLYHSWGRAGWSVNVGKKLAGRLLDGREHNDMPAIATTRLAA